MKRSTTISRLSLAILAALTALFPGCGKSEKRAYPVQGQVFVQTKPAVGALVILTPVENADKEQWPMGYPRGTVQDDGTFKVTTHRPGDGAPPGNYAVTVLWLDAKSGDEESSTDLLEGRYADPSASKIRVEVKNDRRGHILEPFNLE